MQELLTAIPAWVWFVVGVAAFGIGLARPIWAVEEALQRLTGQLSEIKDLIEPISAEAEESLHERRDPH